MSYQVVNLTDLWKLIYEDIDLKHIESLIGSQNFRLKSFWKLSLTMTFRQSVPLLSLLQEYMMDWYTDT